MRFIVVSRREPWQRWSRPNLTSSAEAPSVMARPMLVERSYCWHTMAQRLPRSFSEFSTIVDRSYQSVACARPPGIGELKEAKAEYAKLQ
jgi:hypothetical protein